MAVNLKRSHLAHLSSDGVSMWIRYVVKVGHNILLSLVGSMMYWIQPPTVIRKKCYKAAGSGEG